MANARKHIETERKEVVKVKEISQEMVTLVMTKAEAETLRVILGRVGGNPEKSPRRYAARIFAALGDAGVAWETDHYKTDPSSSIHFLNYPQKAKKAPEVVLQAAAPRGPRVGDTIEFRTNYAGVAKKGEHMVITKCPADGYTVESGVVFGITNGGNNCWIGPVNYRLIPAEELLKLEVGARIEMLEDHGSARKGLQGTIMRITDSHPNPSPGETKLVTIHFDKGITVVMYEKRFKVISPTQDTFALAA
jgi:hypothetical protein